MSARRTQRDLQALLGGARLPAGGSIEERVSLIAKAAKQLLDSQTEAGLFVGGAMLAHLSRGGDLARDYFRIVQPKSHRTASRIYRELQGAHRDERQVDPLDGTIAPPTKRKGKQK